MSLLPFGSPPGVRKVTGSGNIASSGGKTPNITFTGTLPATNGGTGVSNSFNLTITATASISGTNTGDITLSGVGSSPNADAASLSGQVLNLQPFSGSFPGVVLASGGGTTNFLRADGTWTTPPGAAYTFSDSLVNTSGTVTLVNDTASPSASQYYGTNSGSILGYYNLPSSGGVTAVTASGNIASSGGSTPNITFTGVLPIANGGTNNGSLPVTAGGVLYTDGTEVQNTGAGTAGQVLTSTGSTAQWNNLSASSAFAAYASSQITTIGTGIVSSAFSTFSNSPAFTFTPTITGTYKVYCATPLQLTGSSDGANSRIFNTSGGATLLAESQGVVYEGAALANISGTAFCQSTYTLTAGTAYQFDIQGSVNPGGTVYLDGRDGVGSGANCYMFAEGIALTTPQPTGSYAQAYFNNNASWSTTSSSYTDPTWTGSDDTLTVRQSSGITLTAAASDLPGITFTPASASAVYLITAQLGIANDVGSDGAAVQLTDGTTVIAAVAAWDEGASAFTAYVQTISGIYVPGTVSPVTVKLQLAANSGTAVIQPNYAGVSNSTLEWTVLRIV